MKPPPLALLAFQRSLLMPQHLGMEQMIVLQMEVHMIATTFPKFLSIGLMIDVFLTEIMTEKFVALLLAKMHGR